MKLDFLDIARPHERDYFVINKREVELDTTMYAVVKLEKFTSTYKHFQTFSPLLDREEDEEFLKVIIKKEDDVDYLLNNLKYDFGIETVHSILLKIFNFWNERTFRGTVLDKTQDTTKKQQNQ
ncbi:hypothetical protein [Mycoplasmopsis felis]|uniref:hypothetical protein n=1 Tax=Mycoplasmopsis felis TaxID=33923 RepID=UPI002AFFC43C|nr:hypothetical protein [Mycoplasmopsis felis]WQQ06643.1 hypothetical protein RRG37_02195 [Mycoplasmopsis felis]